MYLFRIKADAADIDVPVARALIGTAAIFCLLYRQQHSEIAGITFTIITFAVLLFTQTLLVKYKCNPLLLIAAVSVVVFLATHSFIFPVIIFLIMIVVKKAYKQPVVEINEDGIQIRKTFAAKKYDWQSFGNIILKDNLLTLDFKNNKVLQLEVEGKENFDEKGFSEFCGTRLHEVIGSDT